MAAFKIDLHIHSKYAYRTSKHLDLEKILFEGSRRKLDGIGTGDILHPVWRNEVKKVLNNTVPKLILTTQISIEGIHYLLIFKDMCSVQFTYAHFKTFSKDIDTNGRCNIRISPTELVSFCKTNNILVGLAHAFSPKGYYYHKNAFLDHVDFIQLGLDFDVSLANKLCVDKSLLVASDAHSLYNLARAYIQIEGQILNFDLIKTTLLSQTPYTIVSGIAKTGRYYASGRIRGVSDIVPSLLQSVQRNRYSYRIELTKDVIIRTLYNVNRYTKKYNILAENYSKETDEKYRDGKYFHIYKIGKDGTPGKLIY